MALTAFLPSKAEILAGSQIVPHVNSFNTLLSTTLPKDMRDQFLTRSQELKQEWEVRLLNQFSKIKDSNSGNK